MAKATCPYCDSEVEICHDDGYGYDESEMYQQECNHCGKTFAFETFISFSYETYTAPCLNEESDHEFKLSHTVPKKHSRMYCIHCHEERKPTEQERQLYKLDQPD